LMPRHLEGRVEGMQDPAEVRDWPLGSGGCRLRSVSWPG
jgi:hypothetical protein